jgi:hypothetical protein
MPSASQKSVIYVMDPETFAETLAVPFRMSVASKSNSGKTHLVSQIAQALLAQGKI